VCRDVLKSLKFGLIVGGQPVTGGVVFGAQDGVDRFQAREP
jgi:hypothetical protein